MRHRTGLQADTNPLTKTSTDHHKCWQYCRTMLKVAGAGSVRCRSLTRRAATNTFKSDATWQPSCRLPSVGSSPGLIACIVADKLAAKSGSRSSWLAQISIVDIDGRAAFGRVVGGGQAEDQLLFVFDPPVHAVSVPVKA